MQAIQRDELLRSIGINTTCHSDEAKASMLAVIERDSAVAANSHSGSVTFGIAEMNHIQRACLRERVMTAVQKSL